MCKGKDAHNVNGIMSRGGVLQCICRAHSINVCANDTGDRTQKRLDTTTESIIIVFTEARGRPATDQTIISPREQHTQPAATGSQKRDVPGQRFLRPRRSAAGQVRNAPSRRGRQAIGQRGGECVRLLATVVLPGTGIISGCRACRLVAAQARSTIRTQADPRPDELRGGTPHRRSAHFQFATCQSNCRALWRFGSPAQHRPAVAPSKKTPVNAAPVAASLNDGRLLTAYEELRSWAVQQVQRGTGLALMRTRGFRCWMDACGQLLDAPDRSSIASVKDGPATDVPTGLRGEVVVLLASMLLHKLLRGVA
jgi:hypothetical protein